MPPNDRKRKGLPKRSRSTVLKLARKFCLRCSKRISDKPGHRCGLKDFQKCAECTRKNKSCDKVPKRFFPEVNHLLALAAALSDAKDRPAAQAELATAQRSYTRRVERYIRQRGKRGLKHRPTTTVEAVMLVVDQIQELTSVWKKTLDVMRYDSCLDPLEDDSEDASSEEEEEEEASGDESGDEVAEADA